MPASSQTPNHEPDVRAVALVSGRVQMVGFRFWTHQQAASAHLSGSATNLPDGRVEVVLEGPRGNVERVLDALGSGPAGARVSDVSTRWENPQGERGFRLG